MALYKIIALLIFPFISGEPIKELVIYWKNTSQGNLATYEIDRKKTGWALLVSNGKLKEYNEDTNYVIVGKKNIDKLPEFEIIKEASFLKGVKFRNNKFFKEERKYYLMKRKS